MMLVYLLIVEITAECGDNLKPQYTVFIPMFIVSVRTWTGQRCPIFLGGCSGRRPLFTNSSICDRSARSPGQNCWQCSNALASTFIGKKRNFQHF
eukprot:sb/3479272/